MARLTGEPGYRVWAVLVLILLVSGLASYVLLGLIWSDVFSGLWPTDAGSIRLDAP